VTGNGRETLVNERLSQYKKRWIIFRKKESRILCGWPVNLGEGVRPIKGKKEGEKH